MIAITPIHFGMWFKSMRENCWFWKANICKECIRKILSVLDVVILHTSASRRLRTGQNPKNCWKKYRQTQALRNHLNLETFKLLLKPLGIMLMFVCGVFCLLACLLCFLVVLFCCIFRFCISPRLYLLFSVSVRKCLFTWCLKVIIFREL